MKRIFSGVQPTGSLHLGNYLGAIRHWVDMQQADSGGNECLYGIMDLHAITVPQDPEALRRSTRQTAAALIASGIDPTRSLLVVQSTVQAHSELAWMLSCLTPMGWLSRMTQFKDKAGKKKDMAPLGLYSYPVLMAADVLVYKATHVPVGEDQKQHLELMRDIAGAFNRHVGQEYLPLPEPMILGEATRVMSLRDGTKKMSKSDESDYSRINLTDDADTIAKKCKKAKSDMLEGISYDVEKRPEASNLLTIYAALSGQPRKAVEAEFTSGGFSMFKQALADVAVEKLSPITTEMRRLQDDTTYLDGIIKQGTEKATVMAEENMREMRELMGFLQV